MKWLCVYFVVIILSEIKALRDGEVEEKIIPKADLVNKSFLENCIKTLRNFDSNNKGDSDDILRERKIENLTVEINNSSTATVNKVTNLNATNKENYDKATAAECMKAFQLNINGDYWEQLNSIYKHIKRNLTSSLDKSTSNDAEKEISQTTYKNVATSNTKIKLEFPACPSGETIIVETLEEQYFPFSFFSNLLSLLQPIQFPLGILKDISQRRVPFRHLLLQVLKLEGPLVAWILLWGVLSLCIPCAVIVHSCRRAKNLQRLEDHSSGSSIEDSNNCNRRSMGFLMHFLLFILLLNIILMMGSNEQLSKSIAQSPERAEIIMEDLQSFTKNTEMQINFLTITSIETALDAVEKDLEDVEGLIGIPFQKHIGSTFGLERIFQILTKIRAASYDASKRVKNVMQTCKLAQEVARALEERLGELIPLLNNIHQQCSQRDRALCETLVSSGLDITFRPEEIFSDLKLKYLLHISSDAEFNNSLGEAENNFKEIPRRVALETELQRAEIRNNLQQRRTTIHKALRSLEDLSRSSISTIKSWSRKLVPILEDIASRDMWRYLTILGISIFLFVIWMCFICGAPCGCENTSRAITYLNVGIALSCLVSLCLWIFGSAVLIVGVHGRNLICHSFYDPGYAVFSELLDDGGLFYPNGGFFKVFLQIDQSLNVAYVLRSAERNQSTYNTLKLKNIADIRALVNYENWIELQRKLQSFHVETNTMKILTIKAETFLRPITGKDLNGFLDQAYAVAKQTVDARTGSRMEKLIFKLRSIINSEYKSLSDYKDKILYEVTALEIILKPLEESTEYVLESLRLLQTSLDANENNYAQMNVRNYVEKLTDYLSQFKEHVEYNLKHNVAKLKPLWNIFYTTRITICEELIDAVNAFSFACYLSILLLIFLIPVTKSFIKHYRDIHEDLLNSIIRRNVADEMSPNEQPDWSSPRTSGTPESVINEESAWASRRQSIAIDTSIPPPPRPPTDTRRDPSPRPALPTISGSRSPFSRYESLKLIERIARKTSGSSSSRSWI